MSGTNMWPGILAGGIFWIIWVVVMIATLVAFFRGMKALTQIAATLDRIEQRLGGRPGDQYGGNA